MQCHFSLTSLAASCIIHIEVFPRSVFRCLVRVIFLCKKTPYEKYKQTDERENRYLKECVHENNKGGRLQQAVANAPNTGGNIFIHYSELILPKITTCS